MNFFNLKFIIGIFCLSVTTFIAIGGPLLTRHAPNEQNLMFSLEPPANFSDGYLLGTDNLGRDILANGLWRSSIFGHRRLNCHTLRCVRRAGRRNFRLSWGLSRCLHSKVCGNGLGVSSNIACHRNSGFFRRKEVTLSLR